jgi:hypothetical protein
VLGNAGECGILSVCRVVLVCHCAGWLADSLADSEQVAALSRVSEQLHDECHTRQDHALRELTGLRHACGVAVTVLVLELALRRLNGQEFVRVRQAEVAFFTPFIGAVFYRRW